MKCIVCEQPNQFTMTEVPMPTVKAGEALVRIRRVGICGTDLHAYRGRQPFFSYPRVLGHELAGEIVENHNPASDLQPGDRVTVLPYLECGHCIACRSGKPNCCEQVQVLGVHTDGGMQEYVSLPTTHLIKTNDITLDQAATVECLSIGAHAVRRVAIQPGEYALVIGAGPIGLGVMNFAKQAGAKVIALDMNEGRLAFCSKWADADYTVKASEDAESQIKAITEGSFPTVVFDATGSAGSMMNAFKFVAHGGRLVYVGLVQGDISFFDPDFHKREMTLLSSRNATREDFEHVMNAIRQGNVDTDSFISARTTFDEMIDEFETFLKPESNIIKAVVTL
ncbi:zinc-binding alcohol dehydrogenase family protein [Paenibacillus sp. RC67]|uniref:zinc-binding alcohol dehydrogenase family protein n=1 Tax=Paenibacillus sp. RC67 TaxID=3039392 RepID=UPI0024ACE960|nr:zinc-binding alcohol dehydrogenase family protein [Paenibacillus sp. RC67]